MSATLDKIIAEVRALSPDEQRQLVEQLQAIVPASASEEEREDEFERALMMEGLLLDRRDIAEPATEQTPARTFKPVPVTGKLVSELVVEERR
jgi:hypothetical protein